MEHKIIHKTFDAAILEAKEVGEGKGVVSAIVNTFGIIDKAMPPDIVERGAFTKTIQERAGKIRFLDQHQTDSAMRTVGKIITLREVGPGELPPALLSANPDATGGLYAEIEFDLGIDESRGVYLRYKAGYLSEFSIGFEIPKGKAEFVKVLDPDTGKEITVRRVKEIILWEVSSVIFGASETATTGIKSVVPKQDLPLADRNRAWDSAAADTRIRAWAGGEDDMDWGRYRKAFFWFDSDNPQQFGSFKLGYADIVDGELRAVPRGIFAVAGVLQGARGGADIPQADQDRIKGIVTRWYAQMRETFDDDTIVPPWNESELDLNMNEKQDEKERTADGQEVQRLGDFIWGVMYAGVSGYLAYMLQNGVITVPEMRSVLTVLDGTYDMLLATMGEEMWQRPLSVVPAVSLAAVHKSDRDTIQVSPTPQAASPAGEPPQALTAEQVETALAQLAQMKIELTGGISDGNSSHRHSSDAGSDRQGH